jgi:hypothetical protein
MAEVQATALPPFPTWPPPSGGAPITKWEDGPLPGNPAPGRTFPAGAALGIPGTVINPTTIVRTIGGF